MVKFETRRDAETLVRNPSPRLFDKKFRDSKKVKTNHAKTRLRDLSKTLPRFRDPVKIFRDPRFSRYHSPPGAHNPVATPYRDKQTFANDSVYLQSHAQYFFFLLIVLFKEISDYETFRLSVEILKRKICIDIYSPIPPVKKLIAPDSKFSTGTRCHGFFLIL